MKKISEAFKRIRHLQIKTLKNVNDLFAGNYRSTFKGKGLEFEDVREYQPGDDIRSIDWNVTSRSQVPYVKNFREERELTVMLAVDISASSRFSHIGQLKNEMIAELAALIAFSAIKNQDKVGLLLFTEEVELYLKPKKGLRHVLRVIRELLYFEPKHRGTNVEKGLYFLGQVQKKRAVCFLISDFLSKPFDHQARLISKKHDLIAFHIFDTYEVAFEPKGLFALKDLENGKEVLVDTNDFKSRQFFLQKNLQRQGEVKKTFEKIGVDYISIDTSESLTNALKKFFKLRGIKK